MITSNIGDNVKLIKNGVSLLNNSFGYIDLNDDLEMLIKNSITTYNIDIVIKNISCIAFLFPLGNIDFAMLIGLLNILDISMLYNKRVRVIMNTPQLKR